MKFVEKLTAAVEKNQSLLCVGLDPQESMLPPGEDIEERLVAWAEKLVAATADMVCCYKPNIAFFEQFGPKGLSALQSIAAIIPEDIPILLDAKRGDIGSTAEAYAVAAFQQWHADALTLSPYLGRDSIQPFLANPDKAAFILCQTSNPSASELQLHGEPALFEQVARVSVHWGEPGQIGLVVGATQYEHGDDRQVTVGGVRDLLADAETIFPGIGEYELAEMIAGLRPMTPDNLPILGADPDDPRLVYATGHGRNGIALTPITAATVLADVQGRPVPEAARAAGVQRLRRG